jgi:hypothetical protein
MLFLVRANSWLLLSHKLSRNYFECKLQLLCNEAFQSQDSILCLNLTQIDRGYLRQSLLVRCILCLFGGLSDFFKNLYEKLFGQEQRFNLFLIKKGRSVIHV